ncbi:MAG: hypothetical protein RLZZ28_2709 [Bacteroidota bacterium]|jgi:uroporphyrinogen-III synthase
MPENKITILSTRPLQASLIAEAAGKGIEIEVLSFIETRPIATIDVLEEISLAADKMATVVFTSMNAVEAVSNALDGFVPDWSIYCMGYATRDLVKKHFGEEYIFGTAANAGELADKLIDTDCEELIFFCGNNRRNELPEKLMHEGIEVQEIMVYETENTPHLIVKDYRGILFFSPSAVESFFSVNQIPETALVFAIGETTRQTIQKFSGNRIIVSKEPGKEQLVRQAIAYFM